MPDLSIFYIVFCMFTRPGQTKTRRVDHGIMTGTCVDRYLGAFEGMEKLNEKRAELQKAGEALGGNTQ